MNQKEKDFLNEHFKAGQFYSLSLIINENHLNSFIAKLKDFKLNLAVFPVDTKNGYQSIKIFVKKDEFQLFSSKMKESLNFDIDNNHNKQ